MPGGPVPSKFADLLEGTVMAHLATVDPSGIPQVNPVWILWENGCLHVSVLSETRKLNNMRANPNVALSFLDPEDNRRYLELRGTVQSIERYDDLSLVNRLSRKYTGSDYKAAKEGQIRFHVTIAVDTWTAQG
jgi:PPOX class probable F420-dependent enzyme